MRFSLNKPFNMSLLALLCLGSSCSVTPRQAPLVLTWQMDSQTADSAIKRNAFILKNVSSTSVDGDWAIYYSQMPKNISRVLTPQVTIKAVNANFFQLSPTSAFRSLRPGDSLVIRYESTSSTQGISQVPEEAYWVAGHKGGEGKPLAVNLHVVKPEWEAAKLNRMARLIYQNNAVFSPVPALTASDILPSVKQVEADKEEGYLEIKNEVALQSQPELANEALLLKQQLEEHHHLKVHPGASCVISLRLSQDSALTNCAEKYVLRVHKGGIDIVSATPHGVFNATQSLLAMLQQSHATKRLAWQKITDYPDMSYRGFMLDVARNFTKPQDIKRIIDVLSSYKINKLHIHLTDDEGWRLEIPGLEELTAVGAHRGHTLDEAQWLYPCYDGNFDPTASTSGNGFISRQAFVNLLKYAAQRHVQVIPEIEAPGHARAAIVAMKARYNKYKATDRAKAEEFLLSEAEDTSRYVSAQSYTDNVINVALPSTYRFMEKVVSEVQRMYADAGQTLANIHLGGDEVPKGAWMGSPRCRQLMERQRFGGQHDLFEYFYRRMGQLAAQCGVKFSGWEEVGLHNTAEGDRQLLPRVENVYCWNTVPEWGGDVVPYTVANKGYGVVLCNVSNFYMDLMYAPLFDEQGLNWAGTVNESKSFAALPYSIYRSVRADLMERAIDIDSVARGKVALKREAMANIKGVQAQLFSETIRSFDNVTAYIFPKILGLVERGWNAHPAWEALRGAAEEKSFHQDLSLFYKKIALKELPRLQQQGLTFHLPAPGLLMKEGLLYANTPLTGAVIRYTTDGSDPTLQSPQWTRPVAVQAKTVKARLFYLHQQSGITTINNL
ncbi:Beta-N-acetylhexosaminidase [Hallella multisaccharivorax DSM 17128]|uniref:beta-N-acetylhexosaminidase n=1 Tax=Hallella multisaccharivorax DSM 17128 TaxID=688246 RepID=F8N9E0_9BACT|nr:Beta-N-acetylhexosaminidase [Hallella multisaccharivorax DSM 17128]